MGFNIKVIYVFYSPKYWIYKKTDGYAPVDEDETVPDEDEDTEEEVDEDLDEDMIEEEYVREEDLE